MGFVSLTDYQTAVGTTDNPSAQQLALDAACAAAADYCDRDFGTSDVTETRDFPYDGRGILEIDDAAAITAVTGQLGAANWLAMREGPASVTVYSWLLMPPALQPSGEMGFTRNQDPLGFHFRTQLLPVVTVHVTGTWGWPTIPAQVKQAVIFMASEWQRDATNSGGGNLQAKSVAEVAESYFDAQALVQPREIAGIPDRAADLLWPFKRHAL